jgi:predicted nucleic-acid-binding protein
MVSDLVISETYFALQHHFKVPKEQALAKLAAFLASGDVQADGAASSVLTTPRLATANPGLVDRLIHAQYLLAGTRGMVTFERAATRLPQVRILAGGSAPSTA